MKMKEDFLSWFLVVASVVSFIFCLNAIGSIYNHDFIVEVWCNLPACSFTILCETMGEM